MDVGRWHAEALPAAPDIVEGLVGIGGTFAMVVRLLGVMDDAHVAVRPRTSA